MDGKKLDSDIPLGLHFPSFVGYGVGCLIPIGLFVHFKPEGDGVKGILALGIILCLGVGYFVQLIYNNSMGAHFKRIRFQCENKIDYFELCKRLYRKIGDKKTIVEIDDDGLPMVYSKFIEYKIYYNDDDTFSIDWARLTVTTIRTYMFFNMLAFGRVRVAYGKIAFNVQQICSGESGVEIKNKPAGFCRKCGAPSEEGARFCRKCGNELDAHGFR